MMTLFPQPLCAHSRAARMVSTRPIASKVLSMPKPDSDNPTMTCTGGAMRGIQVRCCNNFRRVQQL